MLSLVSPFCQRSLVVLLVPLKQSSSHCLTSSLGKVTFLICEFYTIEGLFFCFFPLFSKLLSCFHFIFNLTISTEQFFSPHGPMLSCTNFMDLLPFAVYHKWFIFSMHGLQLDCCMLAYFYAAVGQLQLWNTVKYVTKFILRKYSCSMTICRATG